MVVAVLALGLGGAIAGAKKHKKKRHFWASQITLSHPSNTQFEGRASSKLAPCRAERVVTIYYTDPVTGQTQSLSVQRTDGKGRYTVNLTQAAYPGTYYAQISQEKIRALKAPQTCKGAQSKSVGV